MLHLRRPQVDSTSSDSKSLLPLSEGLGRPKSSRRIVGVFPWTLFIILSSLAGLAYLFPSSLTTLLQPPFPFPPKPLPSYIQDGLAKCDFIAHGPPIKKPFDGKRGTSDRFVYGTPDVLLHNATIWTGEKTGEEILYERDILLSRGIIRRIARSGEMDLKTRDEVDLKTRDEVDLNGAWVTPGIVDLHSHLGDNPLPHYDATDDGNSLKGSVQPWLRSVDGFNTHDVSLNLSIAGGITTSLVLPGSANAIGGQAFVFKPRWTDENTQSSMVVEAPWTVTKLDGGRNETYSRDKNNWRYIKHACGENPRRVYDQTRMDTSWDFRSAYNKAKILKDKQDRWCENPKAQTEPFPEDLQWESLTEVLRGKVKVNTHCYTATDMDDFLRISHEFAFPIAAFHHTHESYLIPSSLKQAYGHPPALAIFSSFARYKVEAYRFSEFAPYILDEAGLDVVIKSDHPGVQSRFLVHEAAQAHRWGLKWSKALSSMTTIPARVMGMDHRLGFVREGYDADLVVWDSFPLELAATPRQTYIDGIPQIVDAHVVEKPDRQSVTKEGDWTREAAEDVRTRGERDQGPSKRRENILFTGIQQVYLPDVEVKAAFTAGQLMTAVVVDGKLKCVGDCDVPDGMEIDRVDLKGGTLTKGFVTVGTSLGVGDIEGEATTLDGEAYDMTKSAADAVNGVVVRAEDGLGVGGRNMLAAYGEGVVTGVARPLGSALLSGVGVHYSLAAKYPLAPGAILDADGPVFLNLNNEGSSVSTKIAVLRRLLTGNVYEKGSEVADLFRRVAKGDVVVVVDVSSADVISALIKLKQRSAKDMKLVLLGASESWMMAEELVKADIGVIVQFDRATAPLTWSGRRTLPGLPLSNMTLAAYLASKGVRVALGQGGGDAPSDWTSRNAREDAAWTQVNHPNVFSKQAALDLISTNVKDILELKGDAAEVDASWVAWEGDVFTQNSRVRGIARDGAVEIF